MEKSNVIHIDNDASRLQAVNALIASKLSNYPKETIAEAMKYGAYRLNQGDTAYRAIYKSIQLTRRLVEAPGPAAA